MSNLIQLKDGVASIAEDEWTMINLPASQAEQRVQAGKVVLFKLTGEQTVTPEQIAGTEIPANGKIIVPLSVFIAKKDVLASRMDIGSQGIWLDTHETLESLIEAVGDINKLPIIAIHVERFADGRIFSLGTLLRTRYGFKNELRAFGDVLRDQLFFLKRSGFTSFQIRADRSAEDALASLNDFSAPYQGAVDEPRPVFQRYNRAV
ncbi:MAG: DUF934 domain-containing protein [Methylotenera sp.]